MEKIVELKGITKYIYDSTGHAIRNTDVTILKDVNFELYKGEVHALIGANGAGKSTLMKVLGGIIPPEEGSIVIDGKEVTIANPKVARELGISFVHQELNLCTNLDVAHNLFLGREPVNKFGLIDVEKMYEDSRKLVETIGMEIDVKQPIRKYSTSVQQIIEILKALSFESKIVIMDEPTASLSHSETDILFKLIRDLKSRGISIIYISHRFEEIEAIADRGSVLRDGRLIGTFTIDKFDHDAIVQMMIGKVGATAVFEKRQINDEPVLEVENLKLKENWDDTVTLNVRKGEIVGLAGLVGSGRTELAKSIFTGKGYCSGTIKLNGKVINKTNPRKSVHNGIAYLTEDRKEEGLVLPMSVGTNLTMASLYSMFPNKWISAKKEVEQAEKIIDQLSIVAQSRHQTANTLSGGNQQRVVFGKWISTNPSLLLLDEPTRGVDINAKNEIYGIIQQIARSGIAVLLISSELQEVINLSDRIYTIKNGGIVSEITDPALMTQENILHDTL